MFLVPLLMQAGVLRTVAVTIEPVPYSLAMRRAEAAQTAEIAEEIQRSRQGYVTTARTRRRAQAVYGSLPPATVELRPWFREKELRMYQGKNA
jgi:hypothetical protein